MEDIVRWSSTSSVKAQQTNVCSKVISLGIQKLKSSQKNSFATKGIKIQEIHWMDKAKCQPWIIKKKPKWDENRLKIGENCILHP